MKSSEMMMMIAAWALFDDTIMEHQVQVHTLFAPTNHTDTLKTPRHIATLDGHTGTVMSLCCVSGALISASRDGSLVVRDSGDGDDHIGMGG